MVKRVTPEQNREPGPERQEKHLRLLYVEDNDINWQVCLKRLRSRYDLERARNLNEVIAALTGGVFDVILMDIQLVDSDHDGITITRLLQGQTPRLPELGKIARIPPIIFVTAYSTLYTKADLMKYGAVDLVTKPIDFIDLTLAITRVTMHQQDLR